MKTAFQRHALALAGFCLLTVYGCSGGGGGGPDAGTPGGATTSVPVTVIDDAIENASVCLDKNKNGACDAGEPSGKTDVAGKVTLQVANADVGKFPILAVVGTDAIDAAYGPVTTKFTMTAPADQTAVVSPLTTLVQTTVVNTGVSTADAAASVQSQTGITVSLFQDFTKNTTPEGKGAALIARTIVVVTQEQAKILASALVGSVTQANLDQITQNKVLENLAELVTLASSTAVQGAATPAAITAALTAPAVAIVTDPTTGLTAASVPVLVAINNQNANPVAEAPAATPVATGSLRQLTFTDATNWLVRGFTNSISQNTPDVNNKIRFVDRRASSTAGAVATWNFGLAPNRQSDLHFTGTGWETCGLNGESSSSVRDAAGNSTYDYCNKYETGKGNRATFDVSGKTMASVITEARAAGYTNLSIGNNSSAGLSSVLGTTAFPSGSQIFYQSVNPLTNASAYYPGLSNRVFQSNAALASGTAVACNAVPQAAAAEAATLEGLIAVNAGTQCILTATPATTGPRNEQWGATTLSLGLVGTATTGGVQPNFYTTNTPLRVAFGAANSAKYYACQQRASDGSIRNCNLVGTGTYSIASLGDGRVMSLTGLPLQAAALTYNRVFVERGGKVYFGYQNKATVNNTARLNLAGGNALLNHLGIGAVDPETPLTLSAYSYQGTWDITRGASPTEVTRLSISPIGITSGSIVTNGGTSVGIASTFAMISPITGQFTLTVPDGSIAGSLNFLTGAVTGSFTPAVGAVVAISGARR